MPDYKLDWIRAWHSHITRADCDKPISKVVGKTVFTAEHNQFSTAFSSVFPKGKNKLSNRFFCCRGGGKCRDRGRSAESGGSTCECEANVKQKASVVMQRLSYPTDTVLSHNITRYRIVLSFKYSPRKPIRWRPKEQIRIPSGSL